MRPPARRRIVFYGVLALWVVVIAAILGAVLWALAGFAVDMSATG